MIKGCYIKRTEASKNKKKQATRTNSTSKHKQEKTSKMNYTPKVFSD
jgi:hypothetical protein